jgi:hypothetical protein
MIKRKKKKKILERWYNLTKEAVELMRTSFWLCFVQLPKSSGDPFYISM